MATLSRSPAFKQRFTSGFAMLTQPRVALNKNQMRRSASSIQKLYLT
jgi:hypothetical protein